MLLVNRDVSAPQHQGGCRGVRSVHLAVIDDLTGGLFPDFESHLIWYFLAIDLPVKAVKRKPIANGALRLPVPAVWDP
jgi:hypothetical protein